MFRMPTTCIYAIAEILALWVRQNHWNRGWRYINEEPGCSMTQLADMAKHNSETRMVLSRQGEGPHLRGAGKARDPVYLSFYRGSYKTRASTTHPFIVLKFGSALALGVYEYNNWF